MTKKQLKEYLQTLKQKQQRIEEQVEAINVLLGGKQRSRNRGGVHLKIKEILQTEGPKTLSELTEKLSGYLDSKQPRTTIYYGLKRRNQDFYQDENKKWCLKETKQ